MRQEIASVELLKTQYYNDRQDETLYCPTLLTKHFGFLTPLQETARSNPEICCDCYNNNFSCPVNNITLRNMNTLT
jgi:hypothetical protein